MRWQRRLKSYSSEDYTVFLVTQGRYASLVLRASFAESASNPKPKSRRACAKLEEILLMEGTTIWRTTAIPRQIHVASDGRLESGGMVGQFISTPFRFCLSCGVAYGGRARADFAKLATLGTEGRSTATTVLSLSAVRHLRREDAIAAESRKLLSFTDNRQDASLQAGHFNDFVEVGLLRSALFKAADHAGDQGLTHEVLTQRVFDALALPIELYTIDPAVRYAALTATQKSLRDVLGYRFISRSSTRLADCVTQPGTDRPRLH